MNPVRAAIVVLGMSGSAAGLAGLVRWWHHRKDGPGTGYIDGMPVELMLVTIDGKAVEAQTAAAYRRMRDAAAAAGVALTIVSGFRTLAEQEHLHECYRTGKCNHGNYAEQPGYSEHQSGRALDLNARAAGVQDWLLAHANEHGFFATVAGEPWHWEYWGDSPPHLG